MLDGVFQLSGAILTLYTISSKYLTLPVLGRKSPNLLNDYKNRAHVVFGATLLSIGYILPTIGVDVGSDMEWWAKLAMLTLCVVSIVLVTIEVCADIAQRKYDKAPPLNGSDIFG